MRRRARFRAAGTMGVEDAGMAPPADRDSSSTRNEPPGPGGKPLLEGGLDAFHEEDENIRPADLERLRRFERGKKRAS